MDFEHIAKVGGFYSKPSAFAASITVKCSDISTSVIVQRCRAALDSATAYAHAHFEDPSDIRDWIWTDAQRENA